MLLHCSLLRTRLQKLTGVLEHCREGDTFFRVFLSDLIPKITKDINVNSFHNFRESFLMWQFL